VPESQIKVQLNPDVTPAGSDLSIVNAARRSFNTRSEWNWSKELESGTGDGRTLKPKDKRLLEFLARGMTADDFEAFYKTVTEVGSDISGGEPTEIDLKELLWQWRNTPTHDTPFNHTFISFEVQAPIFVRAQLVKHEYLIMSEFSRRYITDDVEFYTPDVWRKAAENKKQGSSDEEALKGEYFYYEYKDDDSEIPYGWQVGVDTTLEEVVDNSCDNMVGIYTDMVKRGVAPEQARMVLPQSTMTEWTWSGTLGAFAKMCTLRLHPEAQYEARLVAQQVYEYLKEYYPVGAKALVEGV
jgi:thymidylate synthase (FAD)